MPWPRYQDSQAAAQEAHPVDLIHRRGINEDGQFLMVLRTSRPLLAAHDTRTAKPRPKQVDAELLTPEHRAGAWQSAGGLSGAVRRLKVASSAELLMLPDTR